MHLRYLLRVQCRFVPAPRATLLSTPIRATTPLIHIAIQTRLLTRARTLNPVLLHFRHHTIIITAE